jgi:glycosyltransferase involved in cell wall biosynthesis
VRVIENAVDTLRFAPRAADPLLRRALEIGDRDVVVAHCSNLKPWKRPLDLVRSAALTLRKDPRLVYLVIGDGYLRRAMEAECLRLGVLHRFRFAGWVEHAQVPRYLHLADLVAMPSESEARSLVCLEAQACGRVLLASNIPASRELIVDRETGLLFRKGDVDDLAAVTLEAARDAPLRDRIGAAARQAAEQRSLDALLDSYESALRDVVRSHADA